MDNTNLANFDNYKRIMLKLSGEVLVGNQEYGIEADKVIKNGFRVIVFLTDWMPGEFMLWGTTTIQKWKAGWILAWPALKYPHGTSNVSHHVGYRVRCSGLATEETMEWVKNNDIIEV